MVSLMSEYPSAGQNTLVKEKASAILHAEDIQDHRAEYLRQSSDPKWR
jgi:hypothetical protein